MKSSRNLFFFLILTCIFRTVAFGSIGEDIMEDIFTKGIQVDLRNPTYENGVLCTSHGGVISGPDLRVQAMNITYIRKVIDDQPMFKIEAEGQLMLEYGKYVFIGSRLEYDFQTRHGIVYNARSALEPWYFGGEKIELLPDGSYIIYNGFITTSENYKSEWQIASDKAHITGDQFLIANNVQFRFVKLPLFWLPTFKANLDSIFNAPIKYRLRWGGQQGTRLGMIYEVYSWNNFKTFLRLDYRFKRGPGGGIETEYESPDCTERWFTKNYYARDNSLENPNEKTRYRFEGVYHKSLDENRLTVDFTYDKFSDKDMPTDYYERGLDLETGKRTQLFVHRQFDEKMIANFFTHVRLNNFETVKQEIPTFSTSFHPTVLGSTGIISDNQFELGYLDFKYPKGVPNVTDFNSTRFEYRHRFYRPIPIRALTLTPEAGVVAIFYGNSPEHESQMLTLGTFGYDINTQLHRYYGNCKHVIHPYAKYRYYTFPTVSPTAHYIFDIQDGWFNLNTMRFGIRNLIYCKDCEGKVKRYIFADFYADAFFHTPTIGQTIPRAYMRITWDALPTLRNTLDAGWDFERDCLDHFNLRTEWTISENLALATEFRHRSAFVWRKADITNFILDSFRSEQELLVSPLSDRRDTALFHLFYQFRPNWALSLQSRHGWNRRAEPSYNEYEIDLLTTIRSAWHLKLSYQHREHDDRFAVYITLGMKRPTRDQYSKCLGTAIYD